jgi:hypothetical protein
LGYSFSEFVFGLADLSVHDGRDMVPRKVDGEKALASVERREAERFLPAS